MNNGFWLRLCLFWGSALLAAEPEAARRGEQALLTRAFLPPLWSVSAYDNAWRYWPNPPAQRPEPYDQAFREHYGLHPAPYPNGRYPMGLRETTRGGRRGLTVDCLLCHASSICGRSYIGLGNASLDIQALFEDLSKASGGSGKLPFTFCNVRGTSEAGNMAVFLLAHRTPDLQLRLPGVDLEMHDHLCEDVPAWWLLRRKKTMYYTGSTPANSVRALMQFLLLPGNTRSDFIREEPLFRDLQAYLRQLTPPPYPFPIDRRLARQGEGLFRQHCARCHGTYGPDGHYPNRVIPLEEIGTDPQRARGLSVRFFDYYRRSWFGQEGLPDTPSEPHNRGYQAPPLDGIWATAPYFHNGSVPTVYDVLNSRTRPRLFTRSFRTTVADYDPIKLGWKVQVLSAPPDPAAPAWQRRQIYDTRQPGCNNAGHTFGDALTDAERWALIEYLKTL